jgi:hypothetical protein
MFGDREMTKVNLQLSPSPPPAIHWSNIPERQIFSGSIDGAAIELFLRRPDKLICLSGKRAGDAYLCYDYTHVCNYTPYTEITISVNK